MRETIAKLKRLIKDRRWRLIGHISAGGTLEFLGQLRRDGLSVQTSNHYLKAAKQFTRWLVRERKTLSDPLQHISRLNVRTDRRHDRRALSQAEFERLLTAARTGKRVENIAGPDRAILYVMAACYIKHRRADTQVLHPELVRQLRDWLATKRGLKQEEPLFPISARVPGGIDRKTHKMMERDLMAARDAWLEEAQDADELEQRLKSDFLCYCNHDGLYADFHSMRHLFITSLERAGVKPKMAQTLARHSDIRLTLGVYTHVELSDCSAAIESLPAPSRGREGDEGVVEGKRVA